jgi:hypothetical protein
MSERHERRSRRIWGNVVGPGDSWVCRRLNRLPVARGLRNGKLGFFVGQAQSGPHRIDGVVEFIDFALLLAFPVEASAPFFKVPRRRIRPLA